jgi:predicted outer membrane repeat protein
MNKRFRIALASAALTASGAFAAPVVAASGTYYISQSGGAAGVGNGSSCTSPDVIVDNTGVYFNDAMNLILADLNTAANTTIVVCASESDYEMDFDTNPTDFNNVDGNQTLTIKGSTSNRANTVIDGGDTWSPFDVKDANLAISNMTIEDTYDDSDGAAIHLLRESDFTLRLTLTNVAVLDSYSDDDGVVYVAGDLIASNVQFDFNESYANGGAIYVEGNATISSSTFFDNFVEDEEGGAIYVEDNLTLSASVFTANESEDEEGGAIYVSGDATISKSRFIDNRSEEEGSAVYVSGSARISSSYFAGNYTDEEDGALHASDALTVTGSTFFDNEADSEGGAINAGACGAVIITGNTFLSNYAGSSGGAVNIDAFCESDDENRDVEITFLRNKFDQNAAGDSGGAVDIDHDYTTVLFRANRFTNNEANVNEFFEGSGGAIWLHYGRLLGNTFAGNSALCGGAVFVDDDIFGTQKFNGFRTNEATLSSRVKNIGDDALCGFDVE